jgi:hypothetical protein
MRLLIVFACAMTAGWAQTTPPPAQLNLELLPSRLAICRLDAKANVPEWAQRGGFTTITRTPEELSIVCPEANVPRGTKCETARRAFRIAGTVDFALIGVIASLANPLAQAEVSIFVISTYDTDYLMVAEHSLAKAIKALESAGHKVQRR